MSEAAALMNDEPDEAKGDEYLTFSLSGEEYGVDILRVREIRGWEAVTRVPNSPDYMKGVVNLRGSIVPIVDMRLRFGLEERDYAPTTVVIVLQIHGQSGDRVTGVVVDAVSDVVVADTSDVMNTPEFGEGVGTEYLKGLAQAGDKMVMLLDVDKLMSELEDTVDDE